MTTREDLRRRGLEITERMGHGTNPPRPRPLSLRSIPGMHHFTTESIFGAVWARPGLDIRYRMLATLSVLTSLQRLAQLRAYINSALNLDIGAEEIQEVFIHCAIHSGFPTAVNSLELAKEIFDQRDLQPRLLEVPEVGLDELEARGRKLRTELMGEDDAGGYVSAIDASIPDLRRLLLQYGLGEVFHRPGLDMKSRVVCTIASLTSLSAGPQLRNLLPAGVRVGFSRDEVLEILMQTAPYAGFPAAFNAVTIAAEVLPE